MEIGLIMGILGPLCHSGLQVSILLIKVGDRLELKDYFILIKGDPSEISE